MSRGYVYFDEAGTLFPESEAVYERLSAPIQVSREVAELDRRDAERIWLSMWPEKPSLDVVEHVAAKYADVDEYGFRL